MPRDTPHRIEHPLILYPAPLELLDHHPLIRAVAFNGTTARRLYDRHFARRAALTYH